MSNNPLAAYFRQPGIYIKLPSNGYYNFEDEINFTTSGEVAVLPMTAADEIIVNNPDSLLNGIAIERIIQSCCPAIKNPKNLPITDVDVIILASKLVSYGDKLKLSAQCPKCKKETEFALSIEYLLNVAKSLPKECPVRINDDLVAYLRPYTLEASNRMNIAQYEESQLIRNLLSEDISNEERSRAISSAFEKITQLNLELLSNSIDYIDAPEGSVDDKGMIKEFIVNSSSDVVKKLKEGLEEFAKFGLPKETEIVCDDPECGNTWSIPVVYDPSSFFVSDS